MIEQGSILCGFCMFVVSYALLMRGVSKTRVSNLKDVRKMSKTALVNLRLPNAKTGVLQHLKNDEIISKVISGNFNRYYFCVSTVPSDTKELVIDYMSKLYSKVWNEAVQKNCIEIDCCVISDKKDNGLLSDKDVMSLPELQAAFVFDDVSKCDIEQLRTTLGLKPLEIQNTNNFTNKLETDYHKQPSIIFFDTFHEMSNASQLATTTTTPKYGHVALGGTFDQLHNGHRKLLTLAASCCLHEMTVGITGDMMLSKKSQAELIAPYNDRQQEVTRFLSLIAPLLHPYIVELSDPFGPTIQNPNIDAIVVSSETIAGAFKINEIRLEKGMKPLSILVTYRTDSAILSSTFIRDKLKNQLLSNK